MLKPEWIEGPHADGEYSAYALLDEVKYESYRLRVRQWEFGSWIGSASYYANRWRQYEAVARKLPDVETAKAWCETALTSLMLVGKELAVQEDNQYDPV